MRPAHPLQRAHVAIALTSLLIALAAYAAYRASRALADARLVERQRRGAYNVLAEQYDELSQDALAILNARDSWLRLSHAEQQQVLGQLRREVSKRAAGDEHVAAAVGPIIAAADEAAWVPFRSPPSYLSEWEPDPSTLDDCEGCDSPVACQAERHCRKQLPAPLAEPEHLVHEDCGPECAQAWADAAAETHAAEHGGASPSSPTRERVYDAEAERVAATGTVELTERHAPGQTIAAAMRDTYGRAHGYTTGSDA